MSANDPAVPTSGQQRDPTTAPGGASYRVRRSYGPSYALAPAPGGGGSPAGPRARAHGDQPGNRHQGAPVTGGEADHDDHREQPSPSTPAFPDRKPRRRTRNPSERTRKTTTRLSDDEKAEIAAAAAQRGITVARFLATAGLTAARGPAAVHRNDRLDAAIDELAALRSALARIGNNINQIAYVLNSGSRPRADELEHALSVLIRLLGRLDDAANDLVTRRL
ncbi:MobC family plasmid mobilization relaxosome protein [Streptomyces sp. NBC_00264]|uniref:plasmid mobilization protein n=1 Tax=unclassified Streptomyces TaxID=2593676 RepID=UPI0022595BD8|nr:MULTISPECIES: plasmid mobilization relaxosome protein MobC [unclassified Streptomyces]MCX5163743.1 MobC family plasmid mobilization relaxosome protein [Streptomyces sp. NBC_00305]MCX5222266.1 MobC family plasmid mobilization relaxosome protein [Streptomyces sp. NBC_00264]